MVLIIAVELTVFYADVFTLVADCNGRIVAVAFEGNICDFYFR